MEVHRPPGDSLGPPAQDRGLAPHQGPLVSGDHMGLASSLLGPQILTSRPHSSAPGCSHPCLPPHLLFPRPMWEVG